MATDPFTPHLQRARDLYDEGEVVKAGQIWQAILKQSPGHQEARLGLLKVKEWLEARQAAAALQAAAAAAPAPRPEPVAPPAPVQVAPAPEPEPAPAPDPVAEAPAPVIPPDDAHMGIPVGGGLGMDRDEEVDLLVKGGCTLYDMGQLEDALAKWEGALALDPHHRLAQEYVRNVRRELGLEAGPAAAPPPPPPAAPAVSLEPEQDLAKLMNDAAQLYDLGLLDDAISKWEAALRLEPGRADVTGFLARARSERREMPAQAPPPPPPTAGPASSPAGGPAWGAVDGGEALDRKLRQAEHLLKVQRYEEAAFTFQQALQLAPNDPRALQGLERSRKPPRAESVPLLLSEDLERPAPRPEPARENAAKEPASEGVRPPAALTRATSHREGGLSLPSNLQDHPAVLWLRKPVNAALVAGGILAAVGLGAWILHLRHEAQTRAAVREAKDAALAPVAREAQPADISEPPASIRAEAEQALEMDPLRAYYRAAFLTSQTPDDAKAAKLLEEARAKLAGGPLTGASVEEYEQHLKSGDLEHAAQAIETLLRATPDNQDLQARAARLWRRLATAHAMSELWEDARTDLMRGRAMQPGDKAWAARLLLLDRIQRLPKDQRLRWISLL